MEQYGYIKTGIPHTCGEDLVYNLVLPESVHTAVWLLPLIDTRLWYGLPAQGVQNYTEPTTGKFYPHGKPDRRNVLFGDWDIPNILGVKPFKMLCAFMLPTIFGWILATMLQLFYILHILNSHSKDSTEACFGADWDSEWWEITSNDADVGDRSLRIVCTMTFVLEVLHEIMECYDCCRWLIEVPAYQAPEPALITVDGKNVPNGKQARKGHGYTFKYQDFKKTRSLSNGDEIHTVVRKPYTGITGKWRCVILFFLCVKLSIAVMLWWFGIAFLLFPEGQDRSEKIEGIILNTLALFFIFSIDNLVYRLVTPPLARSALETHKHVIRFCPERCGRGIRAWRAWAIIGDTTHKSSIQTAIQQSNQSNFLPLWLDDAVAIFVCTWAPLHYWCVGGWFGRPLIERPDS